MRAGPPTATTTTLQSSARARAGAKRPAMIAAAAWTRCGRRCPRAKPSGTGRTGCSRIMSVQVGSMAMNMRSRSGTLEKAAAARTAAPSPASRASQRRSSRTSRHAPTARPGRAISGWIAPAGPGMRPTPTDAPPAPRRSSPGRPPRRRCAGWHWPPRSRRGRTPRKPTAAPGSRRPPPIRAGRSRFGTM